MKKLTFLLMSALTLTISGCGGGGDSGNTGTVLSGIGATGIIKYATVTAWETTDGIKGQEVGSATTDEHGVYSLTLSPSYDKSNPLLLELTPTKDTRIVCDSLSSCSGKNRGEAYEPTESFKLKSILPPVSGSNVKAQITPFTNMAVSYFKNNPDLGATAAIHRVNQFVGVNVLEVQPIDITGTETKGSVEQQRYALMLAALAKVSFGDGGVSIADAEQRVNDFSAGFKSGTLGGNNGLDPTKFITAIKAEVTSGRGSSQTIDSSTLDQIDTLVSVLEGEMVNNKFTTAAPEYDDVNQTKVTQAKSLMTDVHTWASSFDNLKTPSQGFETQVGGISDVLNAHSETVLNNFILVVESASKVVKDNDNVPSTFNITDNNNNTIEIAITDNSKTDVKSYSVDTSINGVKVGFSIIFAAKTTTSNGIVTVKKGNIKVTVSGSASNEDVKIILKDTMFTIVLNSDYVESDNDPDIASITIAGGILAEVLKGDSTSKVEGDIILGLVRDAKGGKDENGNNEYHFNQLKLTNLTVTDKNGSSADIKFSLIVDNASAVNVLDFIGNNQICNGADNTYSWTYSCNDSESESNFVKGRLEISGELKISGNPNASTSLVVNRSEFGKAVTTMLISYNEKQLTFVVKEESGVLTISNANGIKVSLRKNDNSELTGNIWVNDIPVGTVEEVSAGIIIHYNDGTLESF